MRPSTLRRAVGRAARLAPWVWGLGAGAGALAAQQPGAVTPRREVACAGQPVRDVVVVPQPPYTSALLRRFTFVGDVVERLHATTRPEVVRRFMLLHPGMACEELRRAESERILRVQPFIVDARVRAYATADGGVLLEVETRDEFSLIANVAVRTAAPPVTVLRLGEQNLVGAGIYASGEWRDGGIGYRDGGGARLVDYQFLGRPYQLTLEANRRFVGSNWLVQTAHPFFTDLQRIAWRVSVGGEDEHQPLWRGPAVDPAAVFYRRRWADVGGVLRVGVPGRLSLFGAGLSREYARTSNRVAVLTDSGARPDSGAPLGFLPAERYPGQDVTRVNLIWGVRNVRFFPVVGFETLTGTQDMRRGFQFGTVFGRGASFLGSEDDDYYLSSDLYAGAGTRRAFAATEVQVEGRRESRREEWNGVIASGRAAGFLVPGDRWRVVGELEYTGTWNTQTPSQLELGAFEGGVRGFDRADIGGSRRAVARLEGRRVLGGLFGLGDVGLAAFTDAGRIWAGDAPYGVSTSLQSSVGLGLLGAFPARSRRLWRVDVAYPVTKVPGARWQVRLSNRDLTRQFFREPRDVQRVRERAVPASIFAWP